MKRVVRLTEGQLHNIIAESVKNILYEFGIDDCELPDNWYRTDARRAAIHDIGNEPQSLKDKKNFYREFDQFYVNPDIPRSIVNDEGEEVTNNDIEFLRGDNKYNNEKRRENARHPFRPRRISKK